MADYLNATPAALYQASGDVQTQGETLIGVHEASYRESENAQGGWVGSSSGALTGLLAHWSTVGVDHGKKFGHHVNTLHTSASCFTEMTNNHVEAIEAVYPPSARDL